MTAYQQLNDEQLSSLLQQGDSNAFKEIFERFYGLLFTHAYKRLADEDEAKDLVQELFEVLWTKRQQLVITSTLSSYLYTSVRNRILNYIDHKKVQEKYVSSLGEFLEQDTYCSDYLIREKQLSDLIEQEIDALPTKMREIFILSRKKNLSHKEIADKLNLSEQTVRTQVKKALRILRPRISTFAYLCLLFKF